MRARSTTIAFQQVCSTYVATLNRLCNDEANSVIAFAQDFRKICPPQEPGKEGGYSETEITEIQHLVDGQCDEVRTKMAEWQNEVTALQEQQVQSALCQDEFTKKYEKCTQDLAMSEGLGQKYGAPRRRAQERIRTEVSRDEQSAGFVDELLAKLEFYCMEKQRLMAELGDDYFGDEDEDEGDESSPRKKSDQEKAVTKKPEELGGGHVKHGNALADFENVLDIWKLAVQLRSVLNQRIEYLEIIGKTRLPVLPLPWIPIDRIKMLQDPVEPTSNNGSPAKAEHPETLENGGVPPVSPRYLRVGVMNLRLVVEEVDSLCRKETRELYASENKLSMLKSDSSNSVPDSLEQWLHEAKDKILGRNGHREKAWKRLWSQVDRLEIILRRKPLSIVNLAASQQNLNAVSNAARITVGVPGVCMRYLCECFVTYMKRDEATRVDLFMKSVRIWVKGRDKHERLLRPRLGSPDAVDELNALDAVELQRSQEMINGVIRFRNSLLKRFVECALQYVSDVTVAARGLLLYMDTSLTQDIIQVPPDTAIPKVRLTLKRLRKAERLKNQIANGQEDNTSMRVWPAINLESLVELCTRVEGIILNPSEPKVALIPDTFIQDIGKQSAVRAMVSTAHRTLIKERNRAVAVYIASINELVLELSDKFQLLLKQEYSWNERWKRQVDMLKNGNI